MDRYVRVGQIAGAFGLKGQVKIQPLTDFADARFRRGARFRLGEDWVEIESVSVHKGRPLVKLRGIDTIEAAEALQFKYLETADQPRLEKNQYLIKDLLGMDVLTDDGDLLGKIDRVLPNPAHEIIVIGEIMIPMVDHFVKAVDMEKRTVTVKLIHGMRPGEV